MKGDGRNKLYANFGRYFENVPQLIQFTAFAGASALFSYNFDPIPGAFAPDPASPHSSFLFGGDSALVAPGIKGQCMDERLLGFERDLGRHVIVGVTRHSRWLGRTIEDVNAWSGEYLFGNPGEGSASTLAFMDGSSVPSPWPERRNASLEVTARKRLSGGWQFLGSYVVTRLRGNYDGTQSEPNFNSNFDWADFVVNASGPLAAESVQQAKLDGSYEFAARPAGLNGLSAHWYSASRRTRTGSPLTMAVGNTTWSRAERRAEIPPRSPPVRREVFEDPQVRARAHDRPEEALAIRRQREAQAGVDRRPEIEVRAQRADDAEGAGHRVDRDQLQRCDPRSSDRVEGSAVARPDQRTVPPVILSIPP